MWYTYVSNTEYTKHDRETNDEPIERAAIPFARPPPTDPLSEFTRLASSSHTADQHLRPTTQTTLASIISFVLNAFGMH